MKQRLADQIGEHLRGIGEAADAIADAAERIGRLLAEVFREGGTLLVFGNGGSAADAQHLAAEFVNRYRIERPPLPAIALTPDRSALTAIANDYTFQDVFAKQVRALARPGDVVIGITTSGNSPNVIEGLRVAREVGCRTIALVGRDGGEAAKLVDLSFVAPFQDTARIQETHLLLEHLICDTVEFVLFIEPSSSRKAQGGRRS